MGVRRGVIAGTTTSPASARRRPACAYCVAMARGRIAALIGSLLVLGAALGAGVALLAGKSKGSAPASQTIAHSPAEEGWPFHRKVPHMALRSATGRMTSLAALHGKVVVLAPSLTLCHEVCPITTQAFMTMKNALEKAGLGGKVAFVEATVDPWRDSPARLRAYDKLTGANFIQLTGNVEQVQRFWHWFGVGFKRVPQGKPPDMDWWTHKPETFDVEHTDGVFLIDQADYERSFFPGIADVGGHVSPALHRLLSETGLSNLVHPGVAWTESQVMAGVGRLLGVKVPRLSGGG